MLQALMTQRDKRSSLLFCGNSDEEKNWIRLAIFEEWGKNFQLAELKKNERFEKK